MAPLNIILQKIIVLVDIKAEDRVDLTSSLWDSGAIFSRDLVIFKRDSYFESICMNLSGVGDWKL